MRCLCLGGPGRVTTRAISALTIVITGTPHILPMDLQAVFCLFGVVQAPWSCKRFMCFLHTHLYHRADGASPFFGTRAYRTDKGDDMGPRPTLRQAASCGSYCKCRSKVEMLLSAFVHSFVIMTIAVVAVMDLDVAATGSYYSFGFMVFSWVVLTMNYRATFITTTYNWVFLAALGVSFVSYLLFALVYCNLPTIFPEVNLG